MQARNVTWTVTSTDTSPDERSVIYSSINSVVHLLRLSDPGAGVDADGGFGGRGGSGGGFVGGGGGDDDGDDNDDDGNVGASPFLRSRSGGGFSLSTPRSPYSPYSPAGGGGSGGSGGGGGGGGGRPTYRGAEGGSGRGANADFGVSAHEALDFGAEGPGAGGVRPGRGGRGGGGSAFGIFCAKFSLGGGEIVAGCNDGALRIFDVERGVVSEGVRAHGDDINSVCFAGGSGAAADVVISGSDERLTPLKVWDRRALGAPVATLLGHRAGLTHVAPRGDGVHVLSVGKDQMLKIWDLRRVTSGPASGASGSGAGAGAAGGAASAGSQWQDFDYRWGSSDFERVAHPHDASLTTLLGPAIQSTLVRAHFSPLESTGGRFVYSGSADGVVYVFDALSGELMQQLHRHRGVVRDVSWHPTQPLLASASWDGEMALWCYTTAGAARAREQARSWRATGRSVRARNRAERRAIANAEGSSSEEEGGEEEEEEEEEGDDDEAGEDDGDGDGEEDGENEEDDEDDVEDEDEEDAEDEVDEGDES